MHSERAGFWVTVFAAVWLVGLEVAGLLVPDSVNLTGLLALGPRAVCGLLPARPTSVIAAAAVVLSLLPALWTHPWWSAQQGIRIFDVVLISAAAVFIAFVRVRREQHVHRVEAIAAIAQQVILPQLPAHTDGVNVAARYVSAARDAVIGGDLYDCSVTEGYTRYIVGDVRGKGVAAIEQAARVIRAFRQSAPTKQDMADVVTDMNEYLVPFFSDEEFVTALRVDLTVSGRVTLVSCGHPPALLVKADGSARFLDVPSGLPLGIGADPEPQTFDWEAGDRLLLYTDGLSEARNSDGNFLPVLDQAAVLTTGTVEAALDALLQVLESYVPAHRLGDDLAVVLLECAPDTTPLDGAPAGRRVPEPRGSYSSAQH